MIKLIVLLAFLGIVASLGTALYHLATTGNDSRKMVNALTLRVGLSVALIVFLFVAWAFGLIEPHGINPAAG